MAKRTQAHGQVLDDTVELKNRLEETEETLHAIRQYLVDAFVVTRSNGEQVVTLSNTDFPYRMMVEAMNEGAVTLIPDGTIFYCNPRFGEMVQMEPEKLIGLRFQDLILPYEQKAFEAIFKEAGHEGARGKFYLKTANGKHMPVQLSVYQLIAEDVTGISIIATDMTERMEAEEKIRALASKLTMAEQTERKRISQVLHDDLQQRLFAIRAQLALLQDTGGKDKTPSEFQATLEEIQDWLSNAINVTRSLSIDLSPVALRGEGLTEAVTWLCSHMQEQYGLQVELEAKQDFSQLDDQARVLLFQAVRELLFNVVKHAGSSQVVVILEQVADRVRITVNDSGSGFDIPATMNNPKAAHGLLMIQDRLSLTGGHMEITSKPGRGTRVMIEVPQGRTSP